MRTGSGGRWIGFAVAFLIVAGGTAWWLSSSDGGSTARADTAEVATATVERRDLIERETLDGSLGFADEVALPSARAGTLTRVVDEGAIVKRGGVLFEIDERPTVLLLGTVPAYRSLSSGVEGSDVRQLQRNLPALGYGGDGLEVTGKFDADTAEAVRDWQEDLGLERTGVVELGDVVFEPGPRRMGAHIVEVGAGVVAAGQVATTTSAQRVVTMAVAASDQDLVAAGDRVRVELPGGERVDGRVTTVARVAEADPEDPTAEPTVAVTVRLLGTVET